MCAYRFDELTPYPSTTWTVHSAGSAAPRPCSPSVAATVSAGAAAAMGESGSTPASRPLTFTCRCGQSCQDLTGLLTHWRAEHAEAWQARHAEPTRPAALRPIRLRRWRGVQV